MNLRPLYVLPLVALISLVSFSKVLQAGQSFGMMRDVIDVDAGIQKNLPYVIDDDGFKVVQCYHKEHGVLLKCERPSDEKAGLAFWTALLGHEFTRWSPIPNGVGCLCYVRDLGKEYVTGQTMGCGVFTYYGTVTVPCHGRRTLTVRGFRPATDETVRSVRKSLSEHRENEKRRADDEAAKARRERAQEKRIALREKEIREELWTLRRRWDIENETSLKRETCEALDKERVTLRFPSSVSMPILCGLKLGMSRGDAHDACGEKMDLVKDSYLGRKNVLEEYDENLLVMETRKLKKKFSVFDRVELRYHRPSDNLQLSVVKKFTLIGYVDLNKYSFASCREEYARVRTLLQEKLGVKFRSQAECAQEIKCDAEFGIYRRRDEFHTSTSYFAKIYLEMERVREGNYEQFSIVVDGYEKLGSLLREADRVSQKLLFEARDAKKKSLQTPTATENDAFK